MICPVCKRVRMDPPPHRAVDHACRQRVAGGVVYYVHAYYGYDTGCCGHSILVEAANGQVVSQKFKFMHCKETLDFDVGRIAQELGIRVAWDRVEYVDD